MKERKHEFLKGALVGALVVLLIGGSVLGKVAIAKVVLNGFSTVSGFSTSYEKQTEILAESEEKLQLLEEYLEQYYLYAEELESEELQDGLCKGYIAALGDPYSVYYNEEETKELLETTTGEYGGIGAVFQTDAVTGVMTVLTVYDDSPAQKAGLQEEDILYKVDDEDITGQDSSEVVAKIKGEADTQVTLTILRGEDLQEMSFSITREQIEVQTVAYEMKENKVGYIQVGSFDLVTTQQFEEALNVLQEQGMKGLVIDLRDNPGGNLSTVCEMLDMLLPEGLLVYTEDKNGTKTEYSSDAEQKLNCPMAVLVNGSSASASEIFAGAMQDYEAATIVGATTYGKGVVQQLIDLGDGTCLKLTVSEYYTPKGQEINGKGIEPDEVIEQGEDGTDEQLKRALSIVTEEL